MAENLPINNDSEKQGDEFFNDAQRNRLSELMSRWRIARNKGAKLSDAEQNELKRLTDAEVRATGLRVQVKSGD